MLNQPWNIWDKYSCVPGRGVCVFDPITMMAVALGGAAVSAAGTLMGGNASARAGQAGQAASYFTAAQQEIQAGEARATGSLKASEARRQTRFALSTLRANAAADGGSATDMGVIDLAGKIGGRGEFESLLELSKGENTARGYQDAATSSRMTGDAQLAAGEAAQSASRFAALGTIMQGAGSAYKTYYAKPMTT